MTVKEFITPTKKKFLTAIFLAIGIWLFVSAYEGGWLIFRNATPVDGTIERIEYVVALAPLRLVTTLFIRPDYDRMTSGVSGLQVPTYSIVPDFVFLISLLLLYLVYYYLLACIIVWLFSLRKKKTTQQTNQTVK